MTLENTTICLNDIRLYGYHGLSPEEQAVGSEFCLNLCLEIDWTAEDALTDRLEKSVNYAEAYECLREEFQQVSHTLENVASRILKSLLNKFPQLTSAEVEISKKNPPFGADCQSASVRMKARR